MSNADEKNGENLLHDYANEPFGLICELGTALRDQRVAFGPRELTKDILSRIDDRTFLDGLVVARKKKTVKTIEQRLLDPSSKQQYEGVDRGILIKWMERNPDRVQQINRFAHTLNTTADVSEFKRAMNGIYGAIYGEDYPYFEIPKDPSGKSGSANLPPVLEK